MTSTGRTYAIEVTDLADIIARPNPFSLGPNEVLEGDFELKNLPKKARPLPCGEATILLWSYSLPIHGDRLPQNSAASDATAMATQGTRLIGATYLPRRAMELLRD